MHNSPVIFEVIGPTASGKTTITDAISGLDPRIRSETPPYAGEIRNIPFYAGNAIHIPPLIYWHVIRSNTFSARKVRICLMLWLLNGWAGSLQSKAKKQPYILMLDQGPVYMLSSLKVFFLPSIFSKEFQNWRDTLYQQWAHSLNLIIWLDAPDSVLIKRAKARPKNHMTKTRTSFDNLTVIKNYREAFSENISILKGMNPLLRVACIDTGRNSIDDVTGQIISLVS